LVGSSQLPMALVSWPSLGRKPEIAGMFVMAALVGPSQPHRQGGCKQSDLPSRDAMAIITMEKL
jgi:hypothetical protein